MIDKQETMMVIPPFGNQNLNSNDDQHNKSNSINNDTHS